MELGLAGKRALVTGSSSGIGRGIATMLVREGCRVAVHGLERDEAQAVAAELGANAIATAGDLTTDSGADAVAEAVNDAFGGIDILVNNAGGTAGDSTLLDWEAVDEAAWIATYQLNVVSAVRMIRRFLPAMRAAGWGRVIQVASVVASQPLASGPDYGCAKAAVANLSVSLARALGDCGVTANTISPGTTMTPSLGRWIEGLARQHGWPGGPSEWEARITRDMLDVPVGRIGRPEQVAGLVGLLCSTPAGDYFTGGNYRIDGGQSRSVN